MNRISNSAAVSRLKIILAEEGIRPAVAYLNSLTTHRFTSLYRFNGDLLKNLFFFDREHPKTETCPEIPVQASYCVFVRETHEPFSIANSQRDGRVALHPKRDLVRSYCGVPLLDRNGKMFGSICHFDFAAGSVTNENVELLERMAELLQNQTQSN